MPSIDPAAILRRFARAVLAHQQPSAIYQTSTMGALLDGVYDSDVTLRELLRHGDFGLGTFNGLDGELLVLDGVCHQLRSDGTARIADLDQRTPFAVVTRFRPQRELQIGAPHDRAALRRLIDDAVDSPNLLVAVRVTGEFETVRTRTVTAQHRPYPRFTDATADQREVEFADVRGVLAGFRIPAYEQGVSVAGYHSHFLADGGARGGHALDYRLTRGQVAIGVHTELHLSLPTTPEFLAADLTGPDLDEQIRRTEGG